MESSSSPTKPKINRKVVSVVAVFIIIVVIIGAILLLKTSSDSNSSLNSPPDASIVVTITLYSPAPAHDYTLYLNGVQAYSGSIDQGVTKTIQIPIVFPANVIRGQEVISISATGGTYPYNNQDTIYVEKGGNYPVNWYINR